MAKKYAKKRENGTGYICYREGRRNPYMAQVSRDLVIDGKSGYKSIGSFKTRKEAEEALEMYYQNPLDYTSKIKTFEDLYQAWSEQYIYIRGCCKNVEVC